MSNVKTARRANNRSLSEKRRQRMRRKHKRIRAYKKLLEASSGSRICKIEALANIGIEMDRKSSSERVDKKFHEALLSLQDIQEEARRDGWPR